MAASTKPIPESGLFTEPCIAHSINFNFVLFLRVMAFIKTLLLSAGALALPYLYFLIDGALYAARNGHDPLAVWRYLKKSFFLRPFHRWYFGLLLKNANPFSSAVSMRVEELDRKEAAVPSADPGRQGYCRASLWETQSIRNPFKSIHAAALVLFGETVGGLAVFSALKPKSDRAIVKRLSIEYFKKSRGRITGDCTFTRPLHSGETISQVVLRDSAMDTVAELKIYWTVSLDDSVRNDKSNSNEEKKGR